MVASPAPDAGRRRDLEAAIRFGLDSLGETNSHHEFELLCLELARRRIVTNLLPATGPVSAGGDGGADAESFWTALLTGSPEGTAVPFDGKVVIACTTQRRGVAAKIIADAAKMRHLAPERAVFFLSNSLPSKQRQTTVEAAAAASGAQVEIWDGRAIAHELCDTDLRWIAAEFLRVPVDAIAGTVPVRSTTAPAELDMNRPPTLGDLAEARSGLYRSVKRSDDEAARRWLQRLEWIVSTGAARVAGRAIPSLVFGHGAARKTLLGTERHVARYMSFVPDWLDEGTDLEDAVALLEAATAAAARDAGQFTEDELETWRASLFDVLAARSTDREHDGASRVLRAQLTLVPRLSDAQAAPPTTSLRITTGGRVDLNGLPARDPDTALTLLRDYVRKERHSWRSIQLATSVFEEHADVFAESKHYARVRDGLDVLTSRGSAAMSVEHAALLRAVKLTETKQLAAIREGYRALAHATLDSHSMVNAMMLLASQYWNRDMYVASMFFGLSSAGIAMHLEDMEMEERYRSLQQGAAMGASSAYRIGSWLLAADMYDLAFSAVHQVKPNDWDALGPFIMDASLGHALVTEVLRTHRPAAFKRYNKRLKGPAKMMRKFRTEKFSASKDEAKTARQLQKLRMASPLGDLGHRRRLEWDALGVRWQLEGSTERLPSFALLDLALQMQLIMTEVSDWDLDVVGGTVTIAVDSLPRVDPRRIARPVDYNAWEVTLGIDKDGGSPFIAAATIVAARCTYPSVDAFIKRLQDRCSPARLVVPATFAFAFQPIATDRVWPKTAADVAPLPDPPAVDLPDPPRLPSIPPKVTGRIEAFWRRTHPRVIAFTGIALSGSTPSEQQARDIDEILGWGFSLGHVANMVGLALAEIRLPEKNRDRLILGDARWLRDAESHIRTATFEELGDLKERFIMSTQVWAGHLGLEVEVLTHLTPEDLLGLLDRYGWFDQPADESNLAWLRPETGTTG